MKYIIRSAKTENTEAIKEYIESKLSKLDKYFETSDDIEATVLTKVNGREKVIEVTIPTKHFTLRNEEANEDLYAAIDKIADKLERQIRKNKEKINPEPIYIEKTNAENADEILNMLGGSRLLYKDDVYAYIFEVPTDVQYPVWEGRDENDIEIAAEYEKMFKDVAQIAGSFQDESNAEHLSYEEMQKF